MLFTMPTTWEILSITSFTAPHVGEYPNVAARDFFRVVVLGHPLQDVVRLDEAAQSVDALVQVVLDLIKVTVVAVRDLRRDVALGIRSMYWRRRSKDR